MFVSYSRSRRVFFSIHEIESTVFQIRNIVWAGIGTFECIFFLFISAFYFIVFLHFKTIHCSLSFWMAHFDWLIVNGSFWLAHFEWLILIGNCLFFYARGKLISPFCAFLKSNMQYYTLSVLGICVGTLKTIFGNIKIILNNIYHWPTAKQWTRPLLPLSALTAWESMSKVRRETQASPWDKPWGSTWDSCMWRTSALC